MRRACEKQTRAMLVLAEGVSRAMEKIWWKRREGDEVEGEKSLVVRCEHGKRKCCRRWKRRMKWECAHSEVVEARKRRVVVLVAVVVRVSCGKVMEIMSQLWVWVWQHVRRFVVVLQEHEDGEKDNKRRGVPRFFLCLVVNLPIPRKHMSVGIGWTARGCCCLHAFDGLGGCWE